MKSFYKALDHFRKLIRESGNAYLVEDGEDYWLIDGYCCTRVPKQEMELNPALFKPFKGDWKDIYVQALGGEKAKQTEITKIHLGKTYIPFEGNGFIIWFNKSFLDLFPTYTEVRQGHCYPPPYVAMARQLELCCKSGLVDDIKLFI